MTDSTYTMQETANLLGLSITTIYSYERRQLLTRVEDSSCVQGGVRYLKEQVEQLIEQQKKLVSTGRSANELSKHFGVYWPHIKDAIRNLKMEVVMVRSSLSSDRMEYVLTSEQEDILATYFSRKNSTRPKRNHLYKAHMELALCQAFLLEGKQVRLKEGSKGQVGFELESGEFISYKNALSKLNVKPCYSIHQPKQKGLHGFTDFVLPIGEESFYQVLDLLYRVCGIENFNSISQDGQMLISVRNGDYTLLIPLTSTEQEALEAQLVVGELSITSNSLGFVRTTKTIQLEVKNEIVELLKKKADSEEIPLKEFLKRIIKEKAEESS